MGFLNDVLIALGVSGSRRSKRRSTASLPTLPDPNEVKEAIETVVESITNLKDLPKALIGEITEADRDFREADKSLRSTRIRGKKK